MISRIYSRTHFVLILLKNKAVYTHQHNTKQKRHGDVDKNVIGMTFLNFQNIHIFFLSKECCRLLPRFLGGNLSEKQQRETTNYKNQIKTSCLIQRRNAVKIWKKFLLKNSILQLVDKKKEKNKKKT